MKVSIRRHDTQELVYELQVSDTAVDDVVIPWYAHGPGKGIEPGGIYEFTDLIDRFLPPAGLVQYDDPSAEGESDL